MTSFRVYWALYKTALKSRAEHRVDTAVGVVTAIAMQLGAFAFFWVIFARAPALGGWSPAEVLFLFGFTAMVLGLSEATINGIWWLPFYVVDGQLDRLLVYPLNSLGFVLLSRPELHSVGNFLTGLVTLVIAWSLASPPAVAILLVPVWVICGAIIYTAVLVVVGSLTLRVTGPFATHLFAVHQLFNAARYPANIYPRWLSTVLLFVMPFGAAIFVPSNFLRGQGSLLLALIAPLAAALLTALAANLSWNAALKGYQSTGS
jgi:ABC-2 type transport system permease protein